MVVNVAELSLRLLSGRYGCLVVVQVAERPPSGKLWFIRSIVHAFCILYVYIYMVAFSIMVFGQKFGSYHFSSWSLRISSNSVNRSNSDKSQESRKDSDVLLPL